MRRFLANLLGLYSANVVNGVLGVLLVPFAVHRLGTASYALVSINVVLASYLVLVEMGLGRGIIKHLGGDADEHGRQQILRAACGLYVAMCGGLLVIAPLLVWVVPRFVFPVPVEQVGALQIITALAIAEYVLGVPASLMQNQAIAERRFHRYSRYVLVTGLLRYGLTFGVLLFTTRPEYVVGVVALRRVGDVLLAWLVLGGLPAGSWRPLFNRARFGTLLRHSSAMSVGQLLNLSVVAAGSILVNAMLGIAALGAFRAAFDLASKLWFFSNAIGFLVFPTFVQLWSRTDRRAELARQLPRALLLSLTGYGAVAVVGGALVPWLLDVTRLEGATPAALFVLLVAGVSLNAHCGLAYEFVQAAGGAGRAAMVTAASLIVLVVTFLLTVRGQDHLAIGWAWLVSQTLGALAWDAIVLSYLELPRRAVLRELALRGSVLLGVAVFVLGAVDVVPHATWWLAAALAVPPAAALGRRFRSRIPQPVSA